VRLFAIRLGFTLGIAAVGLCAVLNIATFITTVSFWWFLPCFFLLFGTVMCAKAVESDQRHRNLRGWQALLGGVLFVYAILLFVFRESLGSGNDRVDGHVDFLYSVAPSIELDQAIVGGFRRLIALD
jgi:hypothetical protein